MSNFNLRIAQIQANNFTTKPQNLPQFKNPYLLISKNAAYNKLAQSNQGNLKKKKVQQQNQSQNQSQSQSLQMALDDEEDLARHAMREVYATDRREIAGYTLDKELSTPEHIVYANDSHVLFGLRGSSAVKDFVADAQIGLKSLTGFPDALSATLLNRYARDEAVYNKIRAKYPSQHITMSGHSLGNALGMNLLKNHKSDKNLKFFGYNGWIHPDYNRDKRAYTTRQEGDIVSTFTPTNKTLPEDKTGLGLGGIGAAAGGAEATRRLYKTKLAEATAEIERLQNRRNIATTIRNVDNPATMQAEVSEAFPEYTNFRDIITEAPEGGVLESYANILEEPHPAMYVKTSEVDTLKQFMFRHAFERDVSDYDFDDLREAIQEENADINLAAHPELTDATDVATSSLNTLSRDDFFHNVYVTDGDAGIEELRDYRDLNPEYYELLQPETHSGIMDQSRITTSEILNDEGTIHMSTLDTVTQGAMGEEEGNILAGLETAAEAAGGAVTAAGMATALLAVAGIAGAGYYLYSHSANRFRLKKNQFSKGK